MKKRIVGYVLIGLCMVIAGGLAGAWFATAREAPVARGTNYYDAVSVEQFLDLYGDAVIQDLLNDSVVISVTGGGLEVIGVITSPNIIGGYSGNEVTGVGSIVAGGGADQHGETGTGINICTENYAGVLSGIKNFNYGRYSSIAGGAGNRIDSYYSFIGAGSGNRTYQAYGVIAGGQGNLSYNMSVIGGGYGNQASGEYSVIGAGDYNEIDSHASFGSVLAGTCNTLGDGNDCANSSVPYNRVTINGGGATYGAIVNGERNAVGGYMSLIGNGYYNTIADTVTATVTGVYTSYTDEYLEFSGTGVRPSSAYCEFNKDTNEATCHSSHNAIVGGFANTIANAGIITYTELITQHSPITPAVVVACDAGYSFIGNGISNTVSGPDARYSSILNGYNGSVTSTYASLLGGYEGDVTGDYAVGVGGYRPDVSGDYATNLGGYLTTASGDYSLVGGRASTSSGDYSVALGRQARAIYDGSFVWADNQASNYDAPAANTFNVRASGGVTMTTSGAGLALDGPVIVDGMSFTYTSPITISGILTNVRLLVHQEP
jgi:hypothetical protein